MLALRNILLRSVRRLLERTTHSWRWVGRLPSDFSRAPLVVSPAGGLKFLVRTPGDAQQSLLAAVAELVQPGHVVWDVGGNLGVFSVAAARAGAGGRVWAFEPDPWLVQLLERTASMQSASSAPITVVPAAVADDVNLRTFHIAARSRASNHLDGYGQSQAAGVRETITVVSLSLDWLAEHLPAPHVLKIDVEGAEWDVLRGGCNLLATHAPLVYCEVALENAVKVGGMFREHGYTLYDADRPPHSRTPLLDAAWSTLAVPARLTQGR